MCEWVPGPCPIWKFLVHYSLFYNLLFDVIRISRRFSVNVFKNTLMHKEIKWFQKLNPLREQSLNIVRSALLVMDSRHCLIFRRRTNIFVKSRVSGSAIDFGSDAL